MPRIALVTHAAYPDLTDSDRLLLPPLTAAGATGEAVAWDDPDADWAAYDRIVLRSPWDYHRRPREFTAWINQLETQNAPLWNPAPVVRWNMHKGYLLGLAGQGINIVPTVLLERGIPADLDAVLDLQGWDEAVIKPAISASAYHTWTTTRAHAAASQGRVDALLATGGALVQPLMPQVRDGEWSLVFFAGQYSHAFLKCPGDGVIFTQHELGGTWQPAAPDAALITQAAQVIAAAQAISGASRILYARVDGLLVDGILCLMELELIEPDLFLHGDPAAPAAFAQAILAGD